jgi:hypothetical protein
VDDENDSDVEEEADAGVAHGAQITDTLQVVQLIKGIEYCHNIVVSQRLASERSLLADGKLKQQASVVELLKKQVKEESETLSCLKAFSLKSTAEHVINKLCPADVEAIQFKAWRAMKEKEAESSKVFFDRKKQAAPDHKQTAEQAGTTAAAEPQTPAAWNVPIPYLRRDSAKRRHSVGVGGGFGRLLGRAPPLTLQQTVPTADWRSPWP